MKTTDDIKKRLEELRVELRNECISYGELAELASLSEHIEPDDTELLEAAGVPEFKAKRIDLPVNEDDIEHLNVVLQGLDEGSDLHTSLSKVIEKLNPEPTNEIKAAKELLSSKGYFTGVLWSDEDVMNRFDCTKEEAMKVLEDTFNGEYLCGEINESISIVADINGHKVRKTN